MGFFVGYKWFSHDNYYCEDAMNERAELQKAKEAAERRAEKERRRTQERKKKRKKAERDEQYRQSEEYQKRFNEQFGATASPGGGKGPVNECDGASLYEKYTPQNYDAYKDEIARRFGYLYHSSSGDKAPSLDRGLGVAHHQKIGCNAKYNPHPMGPIAKRIRIPLAFDSGGGGGQHNPENARAIKHDPSARVSGKPGGGGAAPTTLSRPL